MMHKQFYKTTLALSVLALSGCGGSDSSSSSSAVSVAKTSYQVESSAFDLSYVDIPFSVKYNAGDNLYYGIMSDSGNLISRVEYHVNENATGNVTIYFKDAMF